MEVQDKEMFHYHKIGAFDEVWRVGNEFLVDNQFQTYYARILEDFSIRVLCSDDNYYGFDHVIKGYLKDEKFETLDVSFLKQMLQESVRIIKNAYIYTRESILEKYRLENCPYLPSRTHSIWLADEKGLPFWEEQLGKKEELLLYRVLITGNLFQSSDVFIPDKEMTVQEMYQAAATYWNPILQTDEAEEKAEYLFQGKVKVIERLHIPYTNENNTK